MPNMMKYLKGLLFRPHLEIQNNLEDYLQGLLDIARFLRQAMEAYLRRDPSEFERALASINDIEKRLDGLRREIETVMYGRRLLPDTRGDILGMLETLDKIPNRIQTVVRGMKLQNIEIPGILEPALERLVERDIEAVRVLVGTSHAFLNAPHAVRSEAAELSQQEHIADAIEQAAIELIFRDPSLELAHKLQLQRFVTQLGSVCDLAEDVGDRLMVSSLKRLL